MPGRLATSSSITSRAPRRPRRRRVRPRQPSATGLSPGRSSVTSASSPPRRCADACAAPRRTRAPAPTSSSASNAPGWRRSSTARSSNRRAPTAPTPPPRPTRRTSAPCSAPRRRTPNGSCWSRTTIISASSTARSTRAPTTMRARWPSCSRSPTRSAGAGRGFADFARALPPADGVEPVFLSLPMIEAVPYAPGRRFARSDYHGLREHLGRPFVFLSTGRTETYHTERDTPDTLDYAKLGRVTRWVAVLATHAAETDGPLEWRDFTADPLADARSLLRMSAGLGKHGRFPWPLRRALAADRRMVEQLLRRWDAGEAPTPESYRALVLASTRLQAAMWRPGGWYFALW